MAVQFEEQEFSRMGRTPAPQYGGVTALIMKMGLAKTPAQANIVMVVVAIIAISVATYLVLPSRVSAPVTPPTAGLPL